MNYAGIRSPKKRMTVQVRFVNGDIDQMQMWRQRKFLTARPFVNAQHRIPVFPSFSDSSSLRVQSDALYSQ